MISSDLSISLARTDRTVQHVSGRYCFWREKSQYKICSQQNGEERKYLDYLHHFLGLMIFRVIICAKLFCHCLVLSIRKKASSRGEAFITLANLPPAYAGGSDIMPRRASWCRTRRRTLLRERGRPGSRCISVFPATSRTQNRTLLLRGA